MKSFYSSNYETIFDMYVSKSQYYEKLCKQLLNELQESETIGVDTNGEYYWVTTGDRLRDDIE